MYYIILDFDVKIQVLILEKFYFFNISHVT